MPSMTASVASISAGVRLPVAITSIESLSNRQPSCRCCRRYSIIRGCSTSEANLRSAQRTVKARLNSSDSRSMSVPAIRPTKRSRKFSGSTLRAGIRAPIASPSTEKRCTWVVVCFPSLVCVLYS